MFTFPLPVFVFDRLRCFSLHIYIFYKFSLRCCNSCDNVFSWFNFILTFSNKNFFFFTYHFESIVNIFLNFCCRFFNCIKKLKCWYLKIFLSIASVFTANIVIIAVSIWIFVLTIVFVAYLMPDYFVVFVWIAVTIFISLLSGKFSEICPFSTYF